MTLPMAPSGLAMAIIKSSSFSHSVTDCPRPAVFLEIPPFPLVPMHGSWLRSRPGSRHSCLSHRRFPCRATAVGRRPQSIRPIPRFRAPHHWEGEAPHAAATSKLNGRLTRAGRAVARPAHPCPGWGKPGRQRASRWAQNPSKQRTSLPALPPRHYRTIPKHYPKH